MHATHIAPQIGWFWLFSFLYSEKISYDLRQKKSFCHLFPSVIYAQKKCTQFMLFSALDVRFPPNLV